MSKSTITLALGLMSSLSATAVVSQPIATPQLTISAPAIVKSGQDIRVNVTITNGSSKPMTLAVVNGQGNAAFNYDIHVGRPYNQAVERTDYGQSLVGSGTQVVPFSSRLIDLQPGQSYSDYFLLNKIFDVNSPGAYRVQVSEEPIPGRATGQSNLIDITVR